MGENAGGHIRDHFPKETDSLKVADKKVQEAQSKLQGTAALPRIMSRIARRHFLPKRTFMHVSTIALLNWDRLTRSTRLMNPANPNLYTSAWGCV